jgi:hypothetical protein
MERRRDGGDECLVCRVRACRPMCGGRAVTSVCSVGLLVRAGGLLVLTTEHSCYAGWWAFWVPGFNTQITRNSFGYWNLLLEVLIGFPGSSFQVICSAILPL